MLFTVVRLSIVPIVLLGAVTWVVRRRRLTASLPRPNGADAAVWMVGIYLLETLLYPFTNQRRLILILPVVLAWAVLGVLGLGELLGAVWRRARGAAGSAACGARWVGATALVAVGALSLTMLIWQFPRNYMMPLGQETSRPGALSSMQPSKALGVPSDTVETDYIWTTSLFSGHQARSGFYQSCFDDVMLAAAARSTRRTC